MASSRAAGGRPPTTRWRRRARGPTERGVAKAAPRQSAVSKRSRSSRTHHRHPRGTARRCGTPRLERALRQDEEWNRHQTANMNAIVMEQRLARSQSSQRPTRQRRQRTMGTQVSSARNTARRPAPRPFAGPGEVAETSAAEARCRRAKNGDHRGEVRRRSGEEAGGPGTLPKTSRSRNASRSTTARVVARRDVSRTAAVIPRRVAWPHFAGATCVQPPSGL